MQSTSTLLLAIVILTSHVYDGALVAANVVSAQTGAPATQVVVSRITVTLPHDEAELAVEGNAIGGTSSFRTFETAPLAAGRTYRYIFTAKWQPNTYTVLTRTKVVTFRGGETVAVNMSVDDPNDRVQVRYVPTPDDVVEEMVKLAGVSAADVVYEPGCGDARITIAAVKGGARRGVGIDIDAERVTESRANVEAAGLAQRIEIRQGDALDIKDFASATVVFLYMGDHFNLLIRSLLWRDLRVGTRIVSHRFAMGDWQPDKTVTVTGIDGSEYQLHLWTVTDEVKRRAARR